MGWTSKDQLARFLAVARGDEPADVALRNGRVVDLFGVEIIEADVGLSAGRIVGWGRYEASKSIDLAGGYLAPSFIDGHIHLESTLLTPASFAQTVVPWGTGAVVADPHEIANVLGLGGIDYMLAASRDLPLDVFLMASSCVPATPLETSGARLTAEDLQRLLRRRRVLGLAEVMNFPGLVAGDAALLDKVLAFQERVIDGHAPLLKGLALNAYAAAGPASDHECTETAEAQEKLRTGLRIMIRQGSTARNLRDLLPVVTSVNSRRMMFVTDDRHPDELLAAGHLNPLLAEAVTLGLNPIIALQMVTLNPAEYFGLKDRGAIAPGRAADLVVLEDLAEFKPRMVFKSGRLVAQEGALIKPLSASTPRPPRAMRVKPYTAADLAIAARGSSVRVIGLKPGQILTEALILKPKTADGLVLADPGRDLAKLAVVERHQASGRIGLGLVQGFGLKKGALASSVAHDSHNLIGLGLNDPDLYAALTAVEDMGGGLAVVQDGRLMAHLALPIAGLISPEPAKIVARDLSLVQKAARQLGCPFDPFMALSFLALPVVPALKLTDLGLVDVTSFEIVDLFVD